MRDLIQTLFNCEVRQWAEPVDECALAYSAVQFGRLILADSAEGLITELQAGMCRTQLPLAA